MDNVSATNQSLPNPTSMLKRETLLIAGMDCADCAKTLEQGLAAMPGVETASVNLIGGRANVAYDPSQVNHAALVHQVQELGYSVNERLDRMRFRVEGMDCMDCARTVERVVCELPGVQSASVNFGAAILDVNGNQPDPLAVQRALDAAGYRARLEGELARASLVKSRRLPERRVILTAAGALLLALGYLMTLLAVPSLVPVAFFAAAIATGYPTVRAAWQALRVRRIDMNVLMTIAVVGAAAIGAWEEGAMTYVLFMLGTTLQAATLDRARQAVRALAELTPDEASVLRDGDEVRLPIEQVSVGETVRIRPGERVGVDGQVLRGRSTLNQSAITGESIPVEVEPGAPVYAGSLNGTGALEVEVTEPATNNTLARIGALIEGAQAQRSPVEAFIDRFAAWYTPLVVVGAALIAVVPPLFFGQSFVTWFYRALVLLVIACPCALVIATPVAVVAALGNAMRKGVILKGGMALERLAAMRALAFDKTGTLTRSRPSLTDILPVDDSSPDDMLTIAASLEASSEHPLGHSIVAAARERGLTLVPVEDFHTEPGLGVSGTIAGKRYILGGPRLMAERKIFLHKAQPLMKPLTIDGKMVLLLATDRKPVAVLGLADLMRHNAPAVVKDLRATGIEHIALLSGDSPAVVQAVADATGVDTVRAGLMPGDKVTAMQELNTHWDHVGMVGDGVNDAPAMAAASVGIAMGASGTDVALETADVVLMGDDLSRLPWVIKLARSTHGLIRENIAIALVSKAIFLTLGALGIANLWVAVFADMGISLIVTFNALRLLRK